jgi:hypothetical protein
MAQSIESILFQLYNSYYKDKCIIRSNVLHFEETFPGFRRLTGYSTKEKKRPYKANCLILPEANFIPMVL